MHHNADFEKTEKIRMAQADWKSDNYKEATIQRDKLN